MNELVLVCVQKLKEEKQEIPSPNRPLLQRKAINKWIDFWTSDSFPS